MSDRFNWKIVWAAFLVALFGWGFGFYGPPVFLQMLHAQRGWSVSTISSAITFHFVFSAILVAYLPDAYRRYLSNLFRKTFRLEGTPVRIEFRSDENPFKGKRTPLTPRQQRSRKRMMKRVGRK